MSITDALYYFINKIVVFKDSNFPPTYFNNGRYSVSFVSEDAIPSSEYAMRIGGSI